MIQCLSLETNPIITYWYFLCLLEKISYTCEIRLKKLYRDVYIREMKMRRNADELLELILGYVSKIATIRGHTELLPELAEMGRDIVSADRCSVWVLDKKKAKLWTKVAQGVDSIMIPADSGIVGNAIVQKRAMIINDVYADPHFNDSVDIETGYKTETMMVIPMHNSKDEVIGAMQVINKQGDAGFSEEDLRYLNLASTYVAESVESSLLLEEIDATQRELVYIMGVTGESRSKETGNHVRRVAEYSRLLAQLYGLSEEECELLKDASPMHDLGKIAIPDDVLNKPGRFDEEDRRIMNKHTELGYNILKNSERTLLKAAAIVAHQHHEKFDGTGYPNKLKGEEIHIYGRITAVADVFDALGSDRAYKKAWYDEKIFTLFEKERGRHFDPKLIDLFFENLDQFLMIRETFKDEF